jgi:hypothetical protein
MVNISQADFLITVTQHFTKKSMRIIKRMMLRVKGYLQNGGNVLSGPKGERRIYQIWVVQPKYRPQWFGYVYVFESKNKFSVFGIHNHPLSVTRVQKKSIGCLECRSRGRVFSDRGVVKPLTITPSLKTYSATNVTFSSADDIGKLVIIYGVMFVNIRFATKTYLKYKVLSQGTLYEETDIDFKVILPRSSHGTVCNSPAEILERLGQISRWTMAALLICDGFQVFQQFILWMDC